LQPSPDIRSKFPAVVQDDGMTEPTGTSERRPARMKDVAAAAGVSFKTVSNVVHGKPNVGEETRQRVQAVIARMAYRPDEAGRQLRQGRSGMLTLVVPDIVSPYFAELSHAVISAAREVGYAVFLEETGGDPDVELDLLGTLATRVFDGVIFSPLTASAASLRELNAVVPTVFVGEHIAGAGLDHLTYDNVGSMQQATGHLIERGCRRIVFLGSQAVASNSTGGFRLTGYQRALRAAGIIPDRGLSVRVTAFTREQGAAQVAQLLARGTAFDGMVCANDLLAIGGMHALRQGGRHVPVDVRVVGWDDIPDGRFSHPTLTTVAPDVSELAHSAVRMLVRRITDPGASAQRHTIGHRLVVRDSSS